MYSKKIILMILSFYFIFTTLFAQIHVTDGSKIGVVNTGTMSGVRINQNMYLIDKRNYESIGLRLFALDSLLKQNQIDISKAKKDKDNYYIERFSNDKKSLLIEQDSLLKVQKTVIDEVVKDLEKMHPQAKKLEMISKDDSLYKKMTEKYPYGFRMFIFGKHARLPIYNKYESEMDIYVDWDNSDVKLDYKTMQLSVYIHKYSSKIGGFEVEGMTLEFPLPKIGARSIFSYIKIGGLLRPDVELLQDINENKLIVVGFNLFKD